MRLNLESRHQFIYGKNGIDREKFLRQFSYENPVILDDDVPCVIYMDFKELPQINEAKSIDITSLRILSEYLNFSIAYNILSRVISDIPLETLKIRQQEFLARINRIYSTDFDSLEELLNVLKYTIDFYKKNYDYYLKTGDVNIPVNELPICFLDVDFFIRYVKRLLNNNSYFALVFDQQENMPVIFQKLINNFISSRINSDISIKVACEPDEWKIYTDVNGNLIERTHDFGEVDLDGSLKKYVKIQKNKYNVDNND